MSSKSIKIRQLNKNSLTRTKFSIIPNTLLHSTPNTLIIHKKNTCLLLQNQINKTNVLALLKTL